MPALYLGCLGSTLSPADPMVQREEGKKCLTHQGTVSYMSVQEGREVGSLSGWQAGRNLSGGKGGEALWKCALEMALMGQGWQ